MHKQAGAAHTAPQVLQTQGSGRSGTVTLPHGQIDRYWWNWQLLASYISYRIQGQHAPQAKKLQSFISGSLPHQQHRPSWTSSAFAGLRVCGSGTGVGPTGPNDRSPRPPQPPGPLPMSPLAQPPGPLPVALMPLMLCFLPLNDFIICRNSLSNSVTWQIEFHMKRKCM